MNSLKEFSEGFHTFNHDYGSLNDSPDTFNVVLFSNDRDAIRNHPDEASVRARWLTPFAAPLKLEGPWQARLRRLVARNLQSHQFRINVFREYNFNNLPPLVTSIFIERQYYETKLDVIEAVLKTLQGQTLVYHVRTAPYTLQQLQAEKIFLAEFTRNHWINGGSETFMPLYLGNTSQEAIDNYKSPLAFDNANELFTEEEITPRKIFGKICDRIKLFSHVCYGHYLSLSESSYDALFDGNNGNSATVPLYIFDATDGYIGRDTISSGDSKQTGNINTFQPPSNSYTFFRHSYKTSTGEFNWTGRDNYNVAMFLSSKLVDLLGLTAQQEIVALGGSSSLTIRDRDSGDYKMFYLHTANTNFTFSSTTIFVEDQELVTGYASTTSDIATICRDNTTDVKCDIVDRHWIEVISEQNEVVMSGKHFRVKESDIANLMTTQKDINRITKMDQFDVYIPQLSPYQKELGCGHLLKRGKVQLDEEQHKLVNCLPIDREEDMVIYEGNRRSFKWMEPTAGISEMSVELRDTHDKSRSPWFHTGYTMVEIQFQRNWSYITEEKL